jgi:hypothetical protein
MQILARSVIFAVLTQIPALGGSVREDQITAQELAAELGLNTRKIIFTFDEPVYARADFVTVDAGRAVHLPITTSTSHQNIPFYYIIRNTEANRKSLTFQIGDQKITNNFKYLSNPSARVHDAWPDLVMPPKPDSKKPVYLLLDWSPDKDSDLNREMSAGDIAGRMKQGFYLVLYFSSTPFPKP